MSILKASQISWFINNTNIAHESYIGNFEETSQFSISITAINNYLGLEQAESIYNGTLTIEFDDFEDSSLLSYIKVKFDDVYNSTVTITGNRAIVKLPKTLSGDYQNAPTECTLKITLSINEDLKIKIN